MTSFFNKILSTEKNLTPRKFLRMKSPKEWTEILISDKGEP